MAGFPPTFDWILSQQWLTHNFTLAKDQAEASLKSFAKFFFHHRHFDLLAGKAQVLLTLMITGFHQVSLPSPLKSPHLIGMQLPLMLLITPVLFLL